MQQNAHPPSSPHLEDPEAEPLFYKIVEEHFKRTLIQVPLDFQFEPVEIISKELTKLNNPTTEYRVIYLGPRWANNHLFHKNLASNQAQSDVANPQLFGLARLPRYPINLNPKDKVYIMRVANSFVLERNTVYYRAFQGMNPTLKSSGELRFDSIFESGNLDCAIKVANCEYDLFLRIDSNTRGHVLWYFFSASNTQKHRCRFNICNIMKNKNLYLDNMKPFVFSKKKWEEKRTDWQQAGDNLLFEERTLRYDFIYDRVGVRSLMTLSFEYEFEYQEDEVFFAYCVPYTYSMLLQEIEELREMSGGGVVGVDSLGTSLLGVPIPLLKVTDPKVPLEEKRVVLVTGRIHPGEACGSHMVSGFLKYICSKRGEELRKQAVFLVVPMMNPDGVILGNYRTGVSGVDLNRIFNRNNKEVYPQVYHLKSLVKNMRKIKPISLYFDFHGHSSKKNAFTYGPSYKISDSQYYKCKLLPKMVSLRTPMFRYYSCIFRITEGKKDTARAVFFHDYTIPFTYTVEASNGSYYDRDQKQTFDFNKNRWEEIGQSFAIGIQEYMEVVPAEERRELVGTSIPGSRHRFGSPRKLNGDDFGAQHSLQLSKGHSTRSRLNSLIEEIKSDEKRHKKEEEDSEVSSDDNDPEDALPASKLNILGRSIVSSSKAVEEMLEMNGSKTEFPSTKKMDSFPNKRYHFLNKTRKIKKQIPRTFSPFDINFKDKMNKKAVHSLANNSQASNKKSPKSSLRKLHQNLEPQDDRMPQPIELARKSITQYLRKGVSNKKKEATNTSRMNIPKINEVELNVNIIDVAEDEDEEVFRRNMCFSQRKSRNRANSYSQMDKKRSRGKNEVGDSFLYPQVFKFDEFMEQNQKKLTKLNKQADPRHLHPAAYMRRKEPPSEMSKTSYPSAFYKIKQSLSVKKKDDDFDTIDNRLCIQNTRKL